MPAIRPDDLPAASSVANTVALIVDTGAVVEKASPLQIVDAAIPLASQAEAEAGANNAKRMTPLRVKQSIDALGVSQAALATSAGASMVGFLQVGTGAVARTAQGKLRESFSVKDFGAVGDGVTEDTAAFQACFDAAQAAGKGVFIPAGRYVVDELEFGDNSTVAQSPSPFALVGDGKFVSILVAKPGATGTLLKSWTLAGVTFRDFGIDTTGSTMQPWDCQWAVDEEIAPSTQNVIRDILITTHSSFVDGVTPHVNWDKNGDTFPQGVTVRCSSVEKNNCLISMEQPGGITSASEIIWTGGFLRLNCQNARLNDCWGDGLQISDNANNNIDLANTYMYANPTYEACIWCETFDAFQGTKALRISGQLLCDNEDWAFVNVSAYSRIFFENTEFFGASRTLLGPDSRATGLSPAQVRIEGGFGSLDLVNIPSSGPSDPGIIVTAKDFKDPETGVFVTKDWRDTFTPTVGGVTTSHNSAEFLRIENSMEIRGRTAWSAAAAALSVTLPYSNNGTRAASVSITNKANSFTGVVPHAEIPAGSNVISFFNGATGAANPTPAATGDIEWSVVFPVTA